MFPDFITPLIQLAFIAFGGMIGAFISAILWVFSFWFGVPDWAFVAPPMALGLVGFGASFAVK